MDRSRAMSRDQQPLASPGSLLETQTSAQAPSRPPGSGSAASPSRDSRAHSSLRSSALVDRRCKLGEGVGKLVGDSAGGCFQKPRKGHRYSSAMPSALGTNMMSGVFLSCLLYLGKRLPVTMWYAVLLFLFKSLYVKYIYIYTAISLLAD